LAEAACGTPSELSAQGITGVCSKEVLGYDSLVREEILRNTTCASYPLSEHSEKETSQLLGY